MAVFAVYPANAVDTALLYNGPEFFNELTEETAAHVNSFLDIVKLPESNSRVPLWRRAYLSGELECKATKPTDDKLSKLSGIYSDDETFSKGLDACGAKFQKAVYSSTDSITAPACSTSESNTCFMLHPIFNCALTLHQKLKSKLSLSVLYFRVRKIRLSCTWMLIDVAIKKSDRSAIGPLSFLYRSSRQYLVQ